MRDYDFMLADVQFMRQSEQIIREARERTIGIIIEYHDRGMMSSTYFRSALLRHLIDTMQRLSVMKMRSDMKVLASQQSSLSDEDVELLMERQTQLLDSLCTTFAEREIKHATQGLDRSVSNALAQQIQANREVLTVNARRIVDAELEKAHAHAPAAPAVEASAKPEAQAGGRAYTCAVVFTDIVGSTALSAEFGDETMARIKLAHFDRVRKLTSAEGGRLLKMLGDGVLAVFPTTIHALDFALALQDDAGHHRLSVRIGMHVGLIRFDGAEATGTTIDIAKRICDHPVDYAIRLSERAKDDIDTERAARHAGLDWVVAKRCELKGIEKSLNLWFATMKE